MSCDWLVDPENTRVKLCIRPGCNNRLVTDDPPERCFARCASPHAPRDEHLVIAAPKSCVHLGAELRREQCPTCAGHVVVKVFSCAARGECTLAKQIEGVACCQGCGEYQPAERADGAS